MIDREQAIQAGIEAAGFNPASTNHRETMNRVVDEILALEKRPEAELARLLPVVEAARELVTTAILALPDPGPKLSTGYVEDIAWADEMQAEIARLRRVVAAARELAESRWVDCGDPQRLFDFRALRSALAALDGEPA